MQNNRKSLKFSKSSQNDLLSAICYLLSASCCTNDPRNFVQHNGTSVDVLLSHRSCLFILSFAPYRGCEVLLRRLRVTTQVRARCPVRLYIFRSRALFFVSRHARRTLSSAEQNFDCLRWSSFAVVLTALTQPFLAYMRLGQVHTSTSNVGLLPLLIC